MRLKAIQTIRAGGTVVTPAGQVFDPIAKTVRTEPAVVVNRRRFSPGEVFDTAEIGMSDGEAQSLITANAAVVVDGESAAPPASKSAG